MFVEIQWSQDGKFHFGGSFIEGLDHSLDALQGIHGAKTKKWHRGTQTKIFQGTLSSFTQVKNAWAQCLQ